MPSTQANEAQAELHSSTAGRGESPPSAGGPRGLFWLLLVAAVVRLGLWVWLRALPAQVWDEHDYIKIATNLATRGEFAFNPGELTSLRPPLYPTLLSVAFRVFGVGELAPVRLLQAALSLGLIVLTYRLAVTLYDRRVGFLAAAIVAFYPSLLGANHLLLTEVLFTTLLVGACLAMVESVRASSRAGLVLAGVLFGLSALTRSVLWPSFVPFGLWVVLSWRGRWPDRLLAVAVYAAAFLATLAPWSVRNTRLEQTFQAVDSMGGRNLMMGNYEYTPTYRAWAAIGLTGERYWFAVLAKARPEALRATGGQRDKLAMRYGVAFIKSHPGLTLQRDVIKFFDFWGLERELIAGAAEGHFGPMPRVTLVALTLLIFASYAACLFTGIFGAVTRSPSDLASHLFLLLTIALICAAHTLTFGHSRYHLPLIPLIAIYAGAALADVRAIVARRGSPTFVTACGLCVLVLAGWVWNILGPDLDRYLQLLHRAS